MTIRRISRPSAAVMLLAGALLSTGAADAQGVQADPRWQPWLGCWEADEENRPAAEGATLTCVVPVAGTSAVEIATVVDGRVMSRERVDASGERRAATKDGCTGWDRATWSADGRRVFLRAEYDCPGGQKRASSGMIAMFAAGQWLDLRGISAEGATGVGVVRYRDAGLPSTVPSEIASALPGWTRERAMARTVAVAPVDSRAIAEAARQVDAAVVEAWLVERRQGFDLDAKQLVALADAGVPGRVIDVMVAVSYPRAFALQPAGEVALAAPAPRRGGAGGTYGDNVVRGRSLGMDPFDYYDFFGYSRFRYGFSPYGFRYGYSPFGLAYGYAPYGYYAPGSAWYPGSTPVVIVPGGSLGNGRPGPANGQVVNGRGYSRDRSTGGSALPRTNPSRGDIMGSSPSTSAGSGSTAGQPAGASSSGGGSSSGGRTAKPRDP
jgi:uncharacterized membrane protein YgcG